MDVPRLAYRVSEVAAAIGCDPETVRRWCVSGEIPARWWDIDPDEEIPYDEWRETAQGAASVLMSEYPNDRGIRALVALAGRNKEHTPWARAVFAEQRIWLACQCGWNAMGDQPGTWNEHVG